MDEVSASSGRGRLHHQAFDSRILRRASTPTEALGSRDRWRARGRAQHRRLRSTTRRRAWKIADVEISLTMTEFNLLAVLAATPSACSRGPSCGTSVGYPHDLDDHSVDPHVQRCAASCPTTRTPA